MRIKNQYESDFLNEVYFKKKCETVWISLLIQTKMYTRIL